MLPSLLTTGFNGAGLLPHDVESSVPELLNSWLVTGAGLAIPDWAPALRRQLVENLGVVVEKFRQAGGVREIWINGSFVENAPAPGDIDGYFVLEDVREWRSRAFQERLALYDEPGVWSWAPADRRRCRSPEGKPPFWCRYHVELYPDLGRPSDIEDQHGTLLGYPDAFRQHTATYERKGIVRLTF
jgi:hypothetical protein